MEEKEKIVSEDVGSSDAKNLENSRSPKKKRKKGIIIILVLLVGISCGLIATAILLGGKDEKPQKVKTEQKEFHSEYKMSGNNLQDFDLRFLQLENGDKNIIYSPLSIKYALGMLQEGAKGDTKKQIESVLGEYHTKKYTNSQNMSFANAMFIKNTYQDKINLDYTDKLVQKYNAELLYDSFENANNVNAWVKEKTLGNIDNLVDDSIKDNKFLLINALAIDMEWKNLIQATCSSQGKSYSISYNHEDYSAFIERICGDEFYKSLPFNENTMNAKAVEIGASINRYDIVKELGEENIRNTITQEYTKWVEEDRCSDGTSATPVDEYVNQFIKELNENYERVDSSTDFLFYKDDEVKAFAKDLKEYNGITLQYVGIMPQDINAYIKDFNAKKVQNILDQLKEIKLENFEDGKITKLVGSIPLFNYNYDLNLIEDLKMLGIKDVFSEKEADLSKIISQEKVYIDKAMHKANIEFSNEGIKAAAATAFGGFGAASCAFEHLYEVPVVTIDLTFDKPYLFLIREKESGEVWFVGKVVQPTEKVQ